MYRVEAEFDMKKLAVYSRVGAFHVAYNEPFIKLTIAVLIDIIPIRVKICWIIPDGPNHMLTSRLDRSAAIYASRSSIYSFFCITPP